MRLVDAASTAIRRSRRDDNEGAPVDEIESTRMIDRLAQTDSRNRLLIDAVIIGLIPQKEEAS